MKECYACGAKRKLTKHHIVPDCYAKTFTFEINNNLVILCRKCHDKYEVEANKKKKDYLSSYLLSTDEKTIIDFVEIIQQSESKNLTENELDWYLAAINEILDEKVSVTNILKFNTYSYNIVRSAEIARCEIQDFIDSWHNHLIDFFGFFVLKKPYACYNLQNKPILKSKVTKTKKLPSIGEPLTDLMLRKYT